MFCACGVTLPGPEDEEGLCAVCAGAPHHRDCPCDECAAYWARIARESEVAAEEFRRRLTCSCGWVGMWPEHHADRQASCVIALTPQVAVV